MQYSADDFSASPWLSCDLALWQPLICDREPVFYSQKSYLYYQGDKATNVFIIKKGRACITRYQEDGAEKQLYIAEHGCMTGETPAIMEHPHWCSALAIVDSYVYRLSYQELENAMRANWEVNMAVLRLVGRKNMNSLKQIESLTFFQAHRNIARTLLNLCNQYGRPQGNTTVIHLKFTHQDIASIVGVSRVTVCNVFTMLNDAKILNKEKGYFVVLQRDKLQEMAGSII